MTDLRGPPPPASTIFVPMHSIDNVMASLYDSNLTINSNTSFLMAQSPSKHDNTMVLGASFRNGIGGQIVYTSNKESLVKSNISAAAIVDQEYLDSATSLNMLIINNPIGYEYIDSTTANATLVSSVIIACLQRNNSDVSNDGIVISLYFQLLEQYKRNDSDLYVCSFYDSGSKWNQSGCSEGIYNEEYDRYECRCNHLTSFALIWLPQSLSTNSSKQFDAQDIASLVFQGLSIICFIIIMTHATCTRIAKTSTPMQAINLLPLISTASTTILFICFIILSMIVYFQTSSSNQTLCFTSSMILMFILYFLLIFMFCVKTSVGYFYYLRFVRLFPKPSYRRLFIMLTISFVVSLLCVLLAIGFHIKSVFDIIQLYPYKLCWFTRNVIYYFLTIPIGIFLLLNIITIVLVSKSTVHYVRNGATTQQKHTRLKRCVVVLLSSCVTQGIGWFVGPFISFVSPLAGNILSWIFIIFNGLEGLWSILLYISIRLQHIDKERTVSAAKEILKSTTTTSSKNKKSNNKNALKQDAMQLVQKKFKPLDPPYSYNDLRKRDMVQLFNGHPHNKMSS